MRNVRRGSGFVGFGPFRLDIAAGELYSGSRRIPLQEQPFQLLEMLVEQPGEVLTRDYIRNRLWPNGTVVEFDHSINAAIKKLRVALGDSAEEPRYIETVARRGYRLMVPIERLESEPGYPLREKATRFEAEHPAANQTGKKVSHYRVLEILGGGGMGVVYAAEDIKLGRRVALKFLPEEFGNDARVLERFEREARAASSLNHPNICTIHEFGEHEKQPFIVMELLHGQTLRDRLASEGRFRIQELLDLSIQITAGLQAAHQKGIIHRDIKPANIFITSRGEAKVLDFGLAKLGDLEQARSGPELNEAVDTNITRTSIGLGTAAYMSPEQVRGEKLDVRTDIFSFGLVLYEMATGQQAFAGETTPVLHEAILNRSPTPARKINADMSPALEILITKAIEKNREARYQTATEMGDRLNALRAGIAASANRKRRWALRLIGVAVLSFAAVLSFWFVHREPLSRHPLKQRQLTANSSETSVEEGSISPDGKYLAYRDVKGIHIKLLETGDMRTVPEAESLKGHQVDWTVRPWSGAKFLGDAEISGQRDSTWIVPVDGGAPRKLRDNAEPWSASHNGSWIAFTTNSGTIGSREIWLMDPNGEHPRKVLGMDENSHVANVKWSPDDRRLAYLKEHRRGDQIDVSLESVDLAGRTPVTLLSGIPLWAGYAWLPDWRLIYSVAAPDINGLTCNFWQVRVDSRTGKTFSTPESLTDWAGFCTGELFVTSDGKRAVFNKWWSQLNVYVADLASDKTRLSPPRRLTLSSGREQPVGWTQDSKTIVFVSNSNGTWGIFKQKEGEEAAQVVLKRLESAVQARMSPDRKWVLYQEFTGVTSGRLMRVPASGGIPQFVSQVHSASEESPWFGGRGHQPPRCADSPATLCAIAERSANDMQLVFTAVDLINGRGSELMRIPIDPRAAYVWDLSPDATRIALLRRGEEQIHVLSMRGQTLLRTAVRGWSSLQTVNWAVDGKGFFVSAVRQGNSVLLHVDLQGKANLLWEQPGEQEGQLDTYALPSPDGHHLAMLGWTLNSNMWLMEGF